MKNKYTYRFFLLVFISVLFHGMDVRAQIVSQKTCKLMGSRFDFSVVADSEKQGSQFIEIAINEITRIEKLISSWDENSQTSLINNSAGLNAVAVDEELFDLVDRSISVSKLTDGAFDISYASMDKIWKFDGSMNSFPAETEISKSIERVGYENIVLDHKLKTVFLKLEGMKIGFGAIGKGYAADKAKALLVKKGVESGIINASGDLNAWGKQPNGDDWMVAITNPLNKEKVFSWLPVYNAAVVTSGNYEKYVKFDGQLYSHIIDPRTGYPSKGILSVSVLTDNAELADALATSIFVMGAETGLNLINQLKGVECIIVNGDNEILTSDNIEIDHIKQ